MFGIKSKIAAKIDITPNGSQALIVILGVGSLALLLTSCFFAWYGKNYWLPLAAGFILIILVCIMWFTSRKDVDMSGGATTEIRHADGHHFQTDSRTLASPESFRNFEQLVTAVCHRRPLPQADGLVDENLNPVPNSADEANRRVNEANALAGDINSRIIDGVSSIVNSESEPQPDISEPESNPETLSRTNQPQIDDSELQA